MCVLARHKLWLFFLHKALSATDMIYNFPEKSKLPKFITPVKILNWLVLFCGFRSGIKHEYCRDQSRRTFLSRGFPAPRLPCSISRSESTMICLPGIKLNHSVKEIAWLFAHSFSYWKKMIRDNPLFWVATSVTRKNTGEDKSSGARLFSGSRAFFGVTLKDQGKTSVAGSLTQLRLNRGHSLTKQR